MSSYTTIPLDDKSDVKQTLLPIYVDAEAPTYQGCRSKCKKARKFKILTTIFATWLVWRFLGELIHFQFMGNFGQKGTSSLEWLTVPPDVIIDHCTEWQEYNPQPNPPPGHFAAFTELELPISSDKLFLLSRGAIAGAVRVQQGDHEGDVVKVGIIARYRVQAALEQVQACVVNRGEGEDGIGIFGPSWQRRDGLAFQVTVDLPRTGEDAILNVKNFETDMPLFAHHVHDLQSVVDFGDISLKTSNMLINVNSLRATNAHLETTNTPITVKSLHATRSSVKTENGPITGDFNVSSSLKLSTSNSKISVNVNLHNNEDAGSTDLSMQTSNGPIQSSLTLASTKETGGNFLVTATTSTSPIDLTFISAPIDSALQLSALTSLSPAKVHLHKTYQGTFDLKSSLARPTLSYDYEETDPANRGRTRNVEMRSIGRSSVTGSTSWSEEGKAFGSVIVESSLSPVALKL